MDNMKKYLLTVLLLCAVVIIGAWGISVNIKNTKLTNTLETSCRGDFEEFYEDMALMSRDLESCTLSSDPAYIINMLSSAGERAASAKETLSRLPVSQVYAQGVQSLLSKGEEFSKAMLRGYLDGKELSSENLNAIRAISVASQTFLEELDSFYDRIDHEDYRWIRENANEAFEEADDEFSLSLKNMNEALEDMPDMVYDGKYSSHISPKEYKGISGGEVSKDDIHKSLSENMGEGWEVSYSGENGGNLPSHAFSATDGKNSMHVIYSKKGGNLISATSENYPDQSKIDFDEALEKADDFIERLGHEGMDEEYYEVYNNILSVTYAYSHEDIKCLSDTVTVQISLKDGKVLGYEADSYYKNHYDRQSATPAISVDEARNSLHGDMTVRSTSLCYFPTDGGEEILCYEFLVDKNESAYLIYIDAQNGRQREIKRVSVGENTFKVD